MPCSVDYEPFVFWVGQGNSVFFLRDVNQDFQ